MQAHISYASSIDLTVPTSRFSYAISICLFVAIIFSERLHHSFVFGQPRAHRECLLALTSLLHCFVASTFFGFTDIAFSSFIDYVRLQRDRIRAPIFGLFLAISTTRVSSTSFSSSLIFGFSRQVLHVGLLTDKTITRPHAKRFINTVMRSGSIGLSFARTFNLSISGVVGLRLSYFCYFARRQDVTRDYCFFTNRNEGFLGGMRLQVHAKFFFGGKEGRVRGYFVGLGFYRFLYSSGLVDGAQFFGCYVGNEEFTNFFKLAD